MSAELTTTTATPIGTPPTPPAAPVIINPTVTSVLSNRLQELPGLRQLVQILMLAGAIALGLTMFFWTQTPAYAPLFSGLADRDAAEVTEALRAANIPFRLEAGGGRISVPEAQLNEARLKLAAQGLPNGNSRVGFELIQGEQGFGVSQFVEGARYQMALETELARTIATLRPVKDARVHLALPKPSAFTRGREPAGATVLVELYPGRTLEMNQVNAIAHMVATSVPELNAERVTVVDQTGRMLSQPDPNSDEAVSARQFEQQQRLQNDYASRIARLLEPMTGMGRVSSQVSIDMDFSVVEEARESFGDPARVRAETTNEESRTGILEGGVPGAVSNTPNEPGVELPVPSAASRSATRQFEMDRTLSHSRQSVGRVKRVTAAVLIDNIPNGVDEEGKPLFRQLAEDELTRIENLVKQAIGFNAERGDSVTVMNAPFAPPATLPELEPVPFWEKPTIMEWVRLGGGLLALLILAFLMRPTLRQIVAGPTPPQPLPSAAEQAQTGEESEAAAALAHEGGEEGAEGEAGAEGEEVQALTPEQEAMGILAGPANFEQRVQLARAAVAQDPRRVAQVVRTWVNSDG